MEGPSQSLSHDIGNANEAEMATHRESWKEIGEAATGLNDHR